MAVALAHIVTEPEISIEKRTIEDVSSELGRFRHAVDGCRASLENLIKQVNPPLDGETAGILDFQILLLEDTDFIGKMEDFISQNHICAEYAVKMVSDSYTSFLENLNDNDYLRGRSADISDLVQRLLAALSGLDVDMPEPDGDYIAIGLDLGMSRFAAMNKHKLKGIILEKGGITSHCVIMAKSLGIACLIETSGILQAAKNGEIILLDAISGEAVLKPGQTKIDEYEKYKAEQAREKAMLEEYIDHESRTLDGAEIKVYTNIATKSEAEETVRNGGEGVGLFRSEMLFMAKGRQPPSEERQYEDYADTAKSLHGRPLIIRTLDAGGDKHIDYLNIGKESNPFLGYRAIRYCLEHPEIFKPQISAILCASAAGNVCIMFPMITTKTEIIAAKKMVEQVKEDLSSQGKAFDPNIKIGIMIETPAAAFDAGFLAKEVDFFSIGSNDLIQYLFAADRTNTRVAALNSHFQPALLRVINHVANTARQNGIEVDICGQAAEIEKLVPLWIAMDIDNLSVSIPKITAVRRMICGIRKSECVKLLNKILLLQTAEDVEHELGKFYDQGFMYDN
jgi:phosphotransferase system enzyme I (PtsI)